MGKIEREYQTILSIEFSEPDKAKKYFINGDWSESMWKCSDLEDLGETILDSFINSSHEDLYEKNKICGTGKDIEGFNYFLSNFCCDEYTSSADVYGKIIVRVEQEPTRE